MVGLLEETAEHSPVIIATHSDRLLYALSDPAASVVLCELDENRAVRLRRPDAANLADWMEDYRGFGSIRAEGYQAHVFEPSAAKEGPPECSGHRTIDPLGVSDASGYRTIDP